MPASEHYFKTETPLRVGITGGIGSGKTTVCKIFEVLGIPVYYADDRAKMLMTQDGAVKEQILEEFGEEAYFRDGRLNRKYIGAVVFQDKLKLKRLNAIVHPAVFQDGETWNAEQKDVPYTLKEAALLIESGSHKSLDKLIVVVAPENVRIERVMERDGVKKEEVTARMRNQLSDDDKLKHADFTIYNDGEKSLVKQVHQIHQQIISALANHQKSS